MRWSWLAGGNGSRLPAIHCDRRRKSHTRRVSLRARRGGNRANVVHPLVARRDGSGVPPPSRPRRRIFQAPDPAGDRGPQVRHAANSRGNNVGAKRVAERGDPAGDCGGDSLIEWLRGAAGVGEGSACFMLNFHVDRGGRILHSLPRSFSSSSQSRRVLAEGAWTHPAFARWILPALDYGG